MSYTTPGGSRFGACGLILFVDLSPVGCSQIEGLKIGIFTQVIRLSRYVSNEKAMKRQGKAGQGKAGQGKARQGSKENQ